MVVMQAYMVMVVVDVYGNGVDDDCDDDGGGGGCKPI